MHTFHFAKYTTLNSNCYSTELSPPKPKATKAAGFVEHHDGLFVTGSVQLSSVQRL